MNIFIPQARLILVLAGTLFLATGCSNDEAAGSAPAASAVAPATAPAVADESADALATRSGAAPELQRAQAAMADLGQRLKAALTEKMQAEGPVAAVDFCHEEAPLIAADVAKEHGVAVGRTAVRHRSPDNTPTAWQQDVLAHFVEQSETTPPQEMVFAERTDTTLRVAKGIPTQTPCLACHGSNIAEPVRVAIAERYPDDNATGFSEGDLRGMFWAEVPLSASSDQP